MADCLTFILSVCLLIPQSAPFRTDLTTGVISFNNVFFAPFPIGSPVERENDHFHLSLQKYYSLFWSCTVLLTVFDKSFNHVVDFAKLPCGLQDKLHEKGGRLRLGEVMYDEGPGELVFMLVGGGCVIREYKKDEEGKVELRSTTRQEHVCRAIVLGEM